MVGPKIVPEVLSLTLVRHSHQQGERIKDFPGVLEGLQACVPLCPQPILSKQVVR